jgi:hypothetical protein
VPFPPEVTDKASGRGLQPHNLEFRRNSALYAAMSSEYRHFFQTLFCVLVTTVKPAAASTTNPKCTPTPGGGSQNNQCSIPGQACLYNSVLNKFVCSCPNSLVAGGRGCQRSCSLADTSLWDKSCPQGSPSCLLPCNYPRGECDYSLGACICSQGYLGQNCSLECPGSAQTPCSGHGMCFLGEDGQPRCACDEGYLGAACSVACPATACSGHGICHDTGQNVSLQTYLFLYLREPIDRIVSMKAAREGK